MKILAFSDLHCDAEKARAIVTASANADVVVGAGDFANFRRGLEATLNILALLEKPFVLVAGNHETVEMLSAFTDQHAHWHLLHGTDVTVGAVTFFGVGYAIEPGATGDKPTVLPDAVAEPLLARCPRNAVFVTHAPAFGVGDLDQHGKNRGSPAIREAVAAQSPRLHLCGHIHFAWGTSGHIGTTPSHNLGPTVNWFEV
jgi:Icc-related predicted phosphoesterase